MNKIVYNEANMILPINQKSCLSVKLIIFLQNACLSSIEILDTGCSLSCLCCVKPQRGRSSY